MGDLRHALRWLRRSAALTLTAIAALAVGIGSTVAIASAIYAVLYRPPSIPGADRLVVPVSTNAARGFERASVPYADYVDWRGLHDVFDAVALYRPQAIDLAGEGTPERVEALSVSGEYFAVMQARAMQGRVIGRSDAAASAARVAVIGAGLWRRRFAADPAIVGRTIRLGGAAVVVAGVIDESHAWPEHVEVWLPLKADRLDEDVRTRRDNMIFQAVARLRPDVSLAQARAAVATIAARVARDHPESRKGWSTNLLTIRDYTVEPEIRIVLFVLLGGVAMVLLIACVNLANLLLAQAADRSREMAVRTALGASRAQLVRQLMTESLTLALVGGVTGAVLAYWLVRGIVLLAPEDLPGRAQISIDWMALAVAAALTLATAFIFGLAPALAAASTRAADALRSGRGASAWGSARLRELFVVAEMALAMLLLVGAGLTARSFTRAVKVDPGVDLQHVLSGRISLPAPRYADGSAREQFFEHLTTALSNSPGVTGAAAGSFIPAGAGGFGLGRVFLRDEQPEPPASTDYPANWNVISPDFFRVMGMRILRGRAFTADDRADTAPVAIINETMARRVFGDADPIGRKLRSWRDENVLRTIVGVVSDVRYTGLTDDARSLFFVPHRQNPWGLMLVVARASGDPSALASVVRHEVARLDPDVAVADLRTLQSSAAESVAPQRFGAVLLALFGAAATLLAGIGIYGVMANAVARRTYELGVRLALGATPQRLLRLVLGRGIVLTGAGALIGIGAAIMIGPVIQRVLFGVTALDGPTFAGGVAVLFAVGMTASLVPGRRAARTEPVVALRSE